MELFFFLFLFLIGMVLCVAGLRYSNPVLLELASVLSIGLGAVLLWGGGLVSPKIIDYTISSSSVTPVYETFSVASVEVLVLGWLLFWGGFVFLLMTLYYSTVGQEQVEDGF